MYSALTQILFVREYDNERKKENDGVIVFKADVDTGDGDQIFYGFQNSRFGVKLVPYLYMAEDGGCLCLLTNFFANDTVRQIHVQIQNSCARVQTHSHTRSLLVEGQGI